MAIYVGKALDAREISGTHTEAFVTVGEEHGAALRWLQPTNDNPIRVVQHVSQVELKIYMNPGSIHFAAKLLHPESRYSMARHIRAALDTSLVVAKDYSGYDSVVKRTEAEGNYRIITVQTINLQTLGEAVYATIKEYLHAVRLDFHHFRGVEVRINLLNQAIRLTPTSAITY